MATVTTVVTPTQIPLRWSGIPTHDRVFTTAPGGQVTCYNASTIPATGAGDNQRIAIVTSMPRNNAYRLVDLSMSLTGAAAATYRWNQSLLCYLGNAATGASYNIPIQLVANSTGFSDGTKTPMAVYTPVRIPSGVIFPHTGSSVVTLTIDAYNAQANDTAYELMFHARFLEYSLDQALYYTVNTPQPVTG